MHVARSRTMDPRSPTHRSPRAPRHVPYQSEGPGSFRRRAPLLRRSPRSDLVAVASGLVRSDARGPSHGVRRRASQAPARSRSVRLPMVGPMPALAALGTPRASWSHLVRLSLPSLASGSARALGAFWSLRSAPGLRSRRAVEAPCGHWPHLVHTKSTPPLTRSILYNIQHLTSVGHRWSGHHIGEVEKREERAQAPTLRGGGRLSLLSHGVEVGNRGSAVAT